MREQQREREGALREAHPAAADKLRAKHKFDTPREQKPELTQPVSIHPANRRPNDSI